MADCQFETRERKFYSVKYGLMAYMQLKLSTVGYSEPLELKTWYGMAGRPSSEFGTVVLLCENHFTMLCIRRDTVRGLSTCESSDSMLALQPIKFGEME
jgi:hypothetical protein